MRRETQNVLLVLLGGAIIKVCWTGDVTRYVKPSLIPWLIASGVITIALAVIAIVRDIAAAGAASRAAEAHGHDDHGGDHEHSHGVSAHSPWLLILPALAIFLVAPPALGADKVERSAPAVMAAPQQSSDGIGFSPIPADEAPLLSLGDAVTRAVWDDSGTLDDREIRLVGFTVPSADGTTVHLARLAIGCCAADATPVKVTLTGVDPGAYVRDTWLEVRGTMVPDSASEATQWVPSFEVLSATQIEAPENPYEV